MWHGLIQHEQVLVVEEQHPEQGDEIVGEGADAAGGSTVDVDEGLSIIF